MFELDIEMLKEQGLQLVDSAKKTAQDLADKGKNKLDLLNQQARLSKAQRQLGALVYSLHKAGRPLACGIWKRAISWKMFTPTTISPTTDQMPGPSEKRM